MSEAVKAIEIVLDRGYSTSHEIRQTLELALAEIERLRRERDQYKALVEPAYRADYWSQESWSALDAWATALDERNDARRWARRLYRVARQAQEAILDLGRRTCDSYEYKTTNWRQYLGTNMLDAYDALNKALRKRKEEQ